MSSTNKTTNYELSQFLGTDKPAWLADYNSDMNKIDAALKTNADNATAAGGIAEAASTAIGTLSDLTTDAKTSLVAAVNEVDSHADTAQSVANTANTTANGCRTDLNKFNLTNNVNLTPTASLGSIDTSVSKVQFAGDSTNSIFKVYGRLNIRNLSGVSGDLVVKIGDTSLRPSSAYEINSGALITTRDLQGGFSGIGSRNLKVNTDGSIYVVIPNSSMVGGLDGTTTTFDITIFPCLYFNSDFGDQ